MTKAETILARRIEAVAPDLPEHVMGYLARPSEIVARMAASLAAGDKQEDLEAKVEELGGMDALATAARQIDRWMGSQTGFVRLSEDRPDAWDPAADTLFDEFNMDVNVVRQGKLPTRKAIAHLSAEARGVHGERPAPTGVWKGRLVDMLSTILPPKWAPGPDDVALSDGGRVVVRGTSPLLADWWEVYGLGDLEHCPDALIMGAARAIALVLNEVHGPLGSRLETTVRYGHQELRHRYLNALGSGTDASVVVDDLRLKAAHVHFNGGRPSISHFNASSRVTIPSHTLDAHTFRLDCNVMPGRKLEYHDERRHELRLRERGDALRSGGLRATRVLDRLMGRDGVKLGDMRGLFDQETGAMTTSDMRGLGFKRDVTKVTVRNGVIDCHIKLSPKAHYRTGSVHALRTDLPDLVKDVLVGGPLSRLVDHPVLAGATITRLTSARTGSLIARTDLD
jgi:hypothetical protein